MSIQPLQDDQAYPTLTPHQVEIARRFASGMPRHFAPGETLFTVGEHDAPAWLVVEGQLDVSRRDALSGDVAITSFSAGQFSGEVSQLSGSPALAGGRAGDNGCIALSFDASHVRAMLIGAAEIGEIVMRAFIRRRANLIANGAAGCVLVGLPGTVPLIRLEGFLRRNGYPNTVISAAPDGEGAALVDHLGFTDQDLPLVLCPNGEILKSPGEAAIASCLGITVNVDLTKVYDVAIVGAGPAGLAAAVYAGSEGLEVVVLEQAVAGGQAGASMRIENYLGFPEGITGQALMDRAINQASKFGAHIVLPLIVTELSTPAGTGRVSLELRVTDGRVVRSKTVVIASGARYRKPEIPNIDEIDGADISYWVSPIEAKVCSGEDVTLVGGGNSAGQAIVYLAPQVRNLNLIVRRPLEETMSTYLIERINALDNVKVHVGSEIVALNSAENGKLLSATVQNNATKRLTEVPVHHLFLFIGADPNSEWLQSQVEIDSRGFITTGNDLGSNSTDAVVLPLETSLTNVFAIGDIRSGSTKRVASAVGEGAAVVSQIHMALKRNAS